MLATSPMWRSTRWMHAVWWRLLRVGALAGKSRPGRLIPLQTALPRERLHCIHAFCSRPIRPWPCLTHSGLVEEAAVVERAAAAGAAAAAVLVEAAREVVAVAGAAAQVVQAAVVRAVPAAAQVVQAAVG